VVAALGFSATACTTTSGTSSFASANNSGIAFESIDGPPPAVFRRLVQKLTDEAQARNVPVVTREGFAAYRVRGYLAASIEKKIERKKTRSTTTTITWVWDVYDAQQTRAFRISGQETVNNPSGDAWASVDDTLLGKIAQQGMAQLADYLRTEPAPSGEAGRVAFAE
jgi:hypothetical protein